MSADKPRNPGRWLAALLAGLLLTVAFAALTLYLGAAGVRSPPAATGPVRFRLGVRRDGPPIEEQFSRQPVSGGPLHAEPAPTEEMFLEPGASPARKRAHALWPGPTARPPPAEVSEAQGAPGGLLSFGLLAVDLFLLHNVQQIARADEGDSTAEALDDPDVSVMNALFLPPEKVRGLRAGRSRLREGPARGTVLGELVDFLEGAASALDNLGRAYGETARGRLGGSPSPVDCLWTVYCRNLDKTARLDGPYGFLAKMNGLGLRLMMGEFPVEKAMEKLVSEVSTGWTPLNCSNLFPRCSAEEAKEVVMATALGENAV